MNSRGSPYTRRRPLICLKTCSGKRSECEFLSVLIKIDEFQQVETGQFDAENLKMRRENSGNTLQTTALINEVYLRLVDLPGVSWQSHVHFLYRLRDAHEAHPG